MVRANVQREPWKCGPSPELTAIPGEGCVCLSLSRGPEAVRVLLQMSQGLEMNLERRSGPRIRTISGCAFLGNFS